MRDSPPRAATPLPMQGCEPRPLAAYLKALGVLRLIQSPSSNVSGHAADANVRGSWEHASFVLHTTLDRESLEHFLLFDYCPSPIIAPWNGGSGFYPNDNKSGVGPLTDNEVANRFCSVSNSIRQASGLIEKMGLTQRPGGLHKVALVSSLRSRLSEPAIEWLDAALALSHDQVSFPQLLGTGGNDGRLDFTNNYLQRLVSRRPLGLFDAKTGNPTPESRTFLRAALFGEAVPGLRSEVMGQFSPGTAGPNGATGFSGDPVSNPWDFVLTIEGAVMFGGSAARRHQGVQESGASFPFTVRPTGAGAGGLKGSDEESARAEFWAPLWEQPATCEELRGLFREGRAILNGKTARDGLEFARAATSLGTSRGIVGFERYAFVMRAGKAYLATPVGRRHVATSESTSTSLIADLDAGGWLGRLRRELRGKETPTRARNLLQQLEDSLFSMTASNADSRSVQKTIGAIGGIVSWLSSSPSARERINPPPRLSAAWVRCADDETPEFRVAAALASLGWVSAESAAPDDGSQDASLRDLPMAVHLAPVTPISIYRKYRTWADEGSESLAVWTPGRLLANLIAVMERRLVEHSRRGFSDKPFGSDTPARLVDVIQFLSNRFNDRHCARLLAGLTWAKPSKLKFLDRHRLPGIVPFAYSALKPITCPVRDLPSSVRPIDSPSDWTVPLPPGLLQLLRSGRVDDAVRRALRRARSSGFASAFDTSRYGSSVTHFGAGLDSERLAAALLIPLDTYGLGRLVTRAYPPDEENENVN